MDNFIESPNIIAFWIPISFAFVSFIVAILQTFGIIKIGNATYAWTMLIANIYVILFAAILRQNLAVYTERLEDFKSFTTKNIEVLENPSELEITSRIINKITSAPKRDIRVERFFSVPGLIPGETTPAEGQGLLNEFFSYGFPFSYYIGFPWEGKRPDRIETEWQQYQMTSFLISILSNETWSRYFMGSNSLLRKKLIFHIPEVRIQDYWFVEKNHNEISAGTAYVSGEWSGWHEHPKRETVLIIGQKEMAKVIKNEFRFLLNNAIKHLEKEMKKNRLERCICTIFINDDDLDAGLQPMDINSLEEKVEELEGLYEKNKELSKRPYILQVLRKCLQRLKD